MKNLISLCFLVFFTLASSFNSNAQSPCDTCSSPWSAVKDITITGQTIPTKMSTCLYTFLYKIRTRVCNGELQVDIVDRITRLESGCKTFCCLNQPSDCYNSTLAGRRALANLLGPITLSKESACYMMFEVDPPIGFKNCALSPGETVDHWYGYQSCDTTACCKIKLTPLGGGPVQSDEVVSIGCNGNIPSVPSFIEWECGGITYLIPVIPGQYPDCETTCNGSSTIFKNIKTSTDKEILELESLNLYPNPASTDLTINYNTASEGQLELRIYSLQGTLIKSISLDHSEDQLHINTQDLASGQYICHIYSDSNPILSQSFSIID